MARETTTGPTPGIRFAPNPTWCILESDDGRRFTIDCDGGPMLPRKTIATVYNSRRVDGKVNARLIASAPDLLAALREVADAHEALLREYGKPWGWGMLPVETARAALSRAEGKGGAR